MARVLLAVALMTAFAPPALAQDPWGARVRLAISAGLQPEGKGFTQNSELLEYVEPAPVRAAIDKSGAPFVDVGLTVPVAGRLGVQAAFSALTTSGRALVEAGIPHPFFFETLRPVSGHADMERLEMALHGGLAYLIGGGAVDVVLSGGASWFRLRQDLVTDVEFDEAYPFDAAAFRSARLSEANASKPGYHAGADLTWRLSRTVGLGALVRYSRAKVDLAARDVEAAGVRVGGLQVAGGVRLLIP